MMRTEDDLRSVFATIADEIADDRDLGPTRIGRRARTVRRRVLTVAVAAGVAGIVAAGAVIAVRDHSRQPGIIAAPDPSAGTARPIPSRSLGDVTLVGLPDGARTAEIVLERDAVQRLFVQMPVAQRTGVLACVLTVGKGQAPGGFTDTRSSTVGSLPATIGRRDHGTSSEAPTRTYVSWRPAPDRWAESSCADETGMVPTARRLAEGLRLIASPFPVPWTAGSLPFGLTVTEVYRGEAIDGTLRIAVTLSDDPGATPTPPTGNDPDHEVSVQVQSMNDYVESDGLLQDNSERLADLDHRPVWGYTAKDSLEDSRLAIVDGQTVLSLTSTGKTPDELLALARSLTLAPDLGRESSWPGTAADLPW